MTCFLSFDGTEWSNIVQNVAFRDWAPTSSRKDALQLRTKILVTPAIDFAVQTVGQQSTLRLPIPESQMH